MELMGLVVQWAGTIQLKPNSGEFKISSHSPSRASYLTHPSTYAHIFVSLHVGFLFTGIYIIYLIFLLVSFLPPPPPLFFRVFPSIISEFFVHTCLE
jgi:hypothetical protein